MVSHRVLIALDTCSGWSRGVLRGFAQVAHQQGWTILHYHPNVDLDWIISEFQPEAAVLGPALRGPWPAGLRGIVSVAVNVDRSAEGIASACVDEAKIADMALEHLLERGFRNLTTFRFNDAAFGVLRESRFNAEAERADVRLQPGWWAHAKAPDVEDKEMLMTWLSQLERPCGIFACCDPWARVIARYALDAHLRVPEEIALVGVDNDLVECEIISPPLSSVAVPWLRLGTEVARLVQVGLSGVSIAGRRVLVEPTDVVSRRSSSPFAITDPLVAAAVDWIHAHAERRLSVPMVSKAVGATRQRLERRFRQSLGRTILEEIRRARVEIARKLLATTELRLPEVAKRSGFTNAALLSVAFRREVGASPGVYRRQSRGVQLADE